MLSLREQRVVELVREYQKGDVQAFDGIYSLCYQPIYYLIYKMVRDKHEAEDLTQEVFLQIFHRIEDLTDPKSFKCWSNRIAYHSTLDYITSVRFTSTKGVPLEEILESELRADAMSAGGMSIEQLEQRHTIMTAADQLSWPLRATLLLKFFSELRERDIAEIMDVPVGTVKSRLAEAKKKMKKLLGNKLFCFSPFSFYTFFLHLEYLQTGGRAALASSAVVGKAAAAVILSTGLIGSVALRGIRISAVQYRDPSRYVNEQLLRFQVTSGAPIKKISLFGEEEIPLLRNGKAYEAIVVKNGVYTIEAIDIANHRVKKRIRISNIDSEAPVYLGYQEREAWMHLRFSDEAAQIDWDTLCCEHEEQTVEGVSIDRENGVLRIPQELLPLRVKIQDRAGNQAVYLFRQGEAAVLESEVTEPEEIAGETY